MFDSLSDWFTDTIMGFFYRILHAIIGGICKIVYYLSEMFDIFAGIKGVVYDGKDPDALINIFFSNHAVTNVYWGMALLGIFFAFVFAIISVVRRIFDLRDKDQRSLGQILGSLAKSLLLMISMNFIIIVVLTATNRLIQQISYIFNNAYVLDLDGEITFTEEQYAAMGRCLNTIGNYSLNTSYDSRYNVNACYNAIRTDINYLNEQGVFSFYYKTEQNGKEIQTWQSVLQPIAHAADPARDIKVDVYNDAVYKSVKNAMDEMKKNPNIRPLSYYARSGPESTEYHMPLDRYLFLLGTMEAAKSEEFNKHPNVSDPLRQPYYIGEKDIYSYNQVSKDFSMAPGDYGYLIVIVASVAMIWNLIVIIFSAISRIFNVILLYLVSPLVFAAEPLDDGAKRKQWVTAFLVQSLGVIGTIVAMRLMMLFLPIIISDKLVLFQSGFLDFIAKAILLIGIFTVVKKANGMITGILADSAGWQSITAGDTSAMGEKAAGFYTSALMLPLRGAGALGKWAGGKVWNKLTKSSDSKEESKDLPSSQRK